MLKSAKELAEAQASLATAEQQVKDLTARAEAAEGQVATLTAERDTAKKDAADATTKLDAATKENADLKGKLATAEKTAADATTAKTEMENSIPGKVDAEVNKRLAGTSADPIANDPASKKAGDPGAADPSLTGHARIAAAIKAQHSKK